MRLGTVLKAYRMLTHLSAKHVAQDMGVSHFALLRFEKGRSVSNRNWSKILMWLFSDSKP